MRFLLINKKVFVGPWSILWGHWYPLFRTSDDSAHGFQSQGGSIITCILLSLVCNVPQSHLWLPGPGIEPRSLIPKASTIPLRQPDPRFVLIKCGKMVLHAYIVALCSFCIFLKNKGKCLVCKSSIVAEDTFYICPHIYY